MTSFADQTVLVTGANRGMGREYVTQLLDRGVTKIYAAARDPRTIDIADPRVVPLWLDVTDPISVAEAAEAASDVSVLINNAGIARGASVLNRDASTLREEMETNLFGPLAMASAFADEIAGRSGAIVNVAALGVYELSHTHCNPVRLTKHRFPMAVYRIAPSCVVAGWSRERAGKGAFWRRQVLLVQKPASVVRTHRLRVRAVPVRGRSSRPR